MKEQIDEIKARIENLKQQREAYIANANMCTGAMNENQALLIKLELLLSKENIKPKKK